MNTALLDKPLVLALNRSWQAIGHRTVKQALVALNGGTDGIAPAVALDIAYPLLPDGTPDYTRLSSVVPVPWAQWIELPVRDFDLSVNTPRRQIRVPTVIRGDGEVTEQGKFAECPVAAVPVHLALGENAGLLCVEESGEQLVGGDFGKFGRT